jgi:hypothetical protein
VNFNAFEWRCINELALLPVEELDQNVKRVQSNPITADKSLFHQ